MTGVGIPRAPAYATRSARPLSFHSRQGAMVFSSGASAAEVSSKRTWSFPLPGRPVGDGIGVVIQGGLDETTGDDGTGEGGAQ